MKTIPVETLRELMEYTPNTGVLRWRRRDRKHFGSNKDHGAWNGRWAEKPAFTTISRKGYKRGNIFDTGYFAHRVVFALHYGVWPKGQIDHINGDPADNRILNLREVDGPENQKNMKRPVDNTSGIIGVYWSKFNEKWHAKIGVDGEDLHLGYFTDKGAAAMARKFAEAKYGFHENHGRV